MNNNEPRMAYQKEYRQLEESETYKKSSSMKKDELRIALRLRYFLNWNLS